MRAVQSNPNYQQIKELINAVKSTENREMALERAISNNPQYQQAYQEMRQQGGSLKDVFLRRAKEMGVDANDILNMLR